MKILLFSIVTLFSIQTYANNKPIDTYLFKVQIGNQLYKEKLDIYKKEFINYQSNKVYGYYSVPGLFKSKFVGVISHYTHHLGYVSFIKGKFIANERGLKKLITLEAKATGGPIFIGTLKENTHVFARISGKRVDNE